MVTTKQRPNWQRSKLQGLGQKLMTKIRRQAHLLMAASLLRDVALSTLCLKDLGTLSRIASGRFRKRSHAILLPEQSDLKGQCWLTKGHEKLE
jgi:hypothetical protein